MKNHIFNLVVLTVLLLLASGHALGEAGPAEQMAEEAAKTAYIPVDPAKEAKDRAYLSGASGTAGHVYKEQTPKLDRAHLAKDAHDLANAGLAGAKAAVSRMFGKAMQMLFSTNPVEQQAGNILLQKHVSDETKVANELGESADKNWAQYKLETNNFGSGVKPGESFDAGDLKQGTPPTFEEDLEKRADEYRKTLSENGLDEKIGNSGVNSEAVVESAARGDFKEVGNLMGIHPLETGESNEMKSAQIDDPVINVAANTMEPSINVSSSATSAGESEVALPSQASERKVASSDDESSDEGSGEEAPPVEERAKKSWAMSTLSLWMPGIDSSELQRTPTRSLRKKSAKKK